MNKLCLSFLGALLLALYLSSQSQAQTTTTTMAPNETMAMTMTMSMTTYSGNMTANVTEPKNSCGRTDAWTVLLPLTVAASLLHIWS